MITKVQPKRTITIIQVLVIILIANHPLTLRTRTKNLTKKIVIRMIIQMIN